jgi:hypothetical protein
MSLVETQDLDRNGFHADGSSSDGSKTEDSSSTAGSPSDWLAFRMEDWTANKGSAWSLPGSDGEPLGDTDLVQLQSTRELRHRLFYYHHEWEFGPALLEDNVRLALASGDQEEALGYYCYARQTAQCLAEEYGESQFLPAWLELDLRIAEIHRMLGHHESAVVYAKEGLKALRGNRFPADMDALITKLAFRLMRLMSSAEL